eukprot:g3483.t1
MALRRLKRRVEFIERGSSTVANELASLKSDVRAFLCVGDLETVFAKSPGNHAVVVSYPSVEIGQSLEVVSVPPRDCDDSNNLIESRSSCCSSSAGGRSENSGNSFQIDAIPIDLDEWLAGRDEEEVECEVDFSAAQHIISLPDVFPDKHYDDDDGDKDPIESAMWPKDIAGDVADLFGVKSDHHNDDDGDDDDEHFDSDVLFPYEYDYDYGPLADLKSPLAAPSSELSAPVLFCHRSYPPEASVTIPTEALDMLFSSEPMLV